jgi:outer membrane protein TolC
VCTHVSRPQYLFWETFDGGRRHATSPDARANYDATVANYRESTLTAFQQVEVNLAALRILSDEAKRQKEATASAQESFAGADLSDTGYRSRRLSPAAAKVW